MAIVDIAWFKSTKVTRTSIRFSTRLRWGKNIPGLNKYVAWLVFPIQFLKGVYSKCILDGRLRQNRPSPSTFSIVSSSCGDTNIHIVSWHLLSRFARMFRPQLLYSMISTWSWNDACCSVSLNQIRIRYQLNTTSLAWPSIKICFKNKTAYYEDVYQK